MFLISIRNAVTGEEKQFADKQAIADFLAGRHDAADWEGHQALGELPPATQSAGQEAPALTDLDTVPGFDSRDETAPPVGDILPQADPNTFMQAVKGILGFGS